MTDSDIRGVLHAHTDLSDGVDTLETMAEATRTRGYQYFGVADQLEFAAYAVHIHGDPSLAMVWLDRHQGPAQLKAQKTAFAHVNVAASVNSANHHAGQRFEELYQRTIDFGGHPNERSVTGNMKMIEEAERRVMLAVLLHGDGPELDMALKTTAQCGMVCLEMLQAIYDAKFELLGINAAMLELRKGL